MIGGEKASSLQSILELEAKLDGQLVDWRTVERFEPLWLADGRRWSSAIWDLAVAAGPLDLSSDVIRAGLAVARRPLFIGGAHRSGTTLVRDLLDGHPALIVLPAEAMYFGAMERLPSQDRVRGVGEAWLQRLMNPANQPPFWLLGRSTVDGSAYVEFARLYQSWVALLEAAGEKAAPLQAVALAYGQLRNQAFEHVAYWVEKTPGTERHLDRIMRDFPDAKFIHMIREPRAVLTSYQAVLRRANRAAPPMSAMIWGLIRSFASASRKISPASARLILRYEDLVGRRSAATERVAGFLNVDVTPELLRQTVAGRSAEANTVTDRTEQARLKLTWFESLLLGRALSLYRRHFPSGENAISTLEPPALPL